MTRGRVWARRAAIAGVASVVVATALASRAVGSAPVAFTAGQGYAAGRALALVDAFGGARFGFNVDDLTGQYQDGTGTGTGASIDSGLISVISELQTCGTYAFPSALVLPTTTASTNTNHNAAPVTASNSSTAESAFGAVTALAKPNALGQADAVTGSLALPGLFALGGAAVHTASATQAGREARTAIADVRDGSVSLLGGLIQLRGLRWTASVSVSGPDSRADRRSAVPTFSMGGASVAGVDIPFNAPASYASSLDALNKLTGPLGVQIRLPVIQASGGQASVGPLTVALGGRTLVGPVLQQLLGGATLPNIEHALKPGVFDPTTCKELGGLLGAVKPVNAQWNLLGAGYPIILAAAIGSIAGSGELDLDFGGASANVDDTYYAAPSYTAPGFASSVPAPIVSQTASAGTPAQPGTPVAGRPGSGAGAELVTTRRSVACRTASPVGGPMCWGGHAVAGGLAAGVLTMALLAADEQVRRRKVAR